MEERITEAIRWVGVNDRRNELFESYWPIPDGISYNSYLISDEVNVLIDGVKGGFTERYLNKISETTDLEDINYLVINHMEPDHTGAFPALRRINPDITFIGTEKASELLDSFYGITEGVKVVESNDSLDLGSQTLEFVETPFVHWPETMMTYHREKGILFSGDGFGTYGALDGGIFDDQLNAEWYRDEAIRYLSNIVGAYSATLQAAMAKLQDLDIEVIAPTHGPVWRENPENIQELYDRFSSGEANTGVTIIYGSMYGFTEKVMERVAGGVISAGLENLEVLDAAEVHPSYLISSAWRKKGLIIGSPTYESRAFPPVSTFLDLAGKKKLKDRVAGIFGSYGWGGGSAREIEEACEKLNWEIASPTVEFNGDPGKDQLESGFELGRSVAEKVLG